MFLSSAGLVSVAGASFVLATAAQPAAKWNVEKMSHVSVSGVESQLNVGCSRDVLGLINIGREFSDTAVARSNGGESTTWPPHTTNFKTTVFT